MVEALAEGAVGPRLEPRALELGQRRHQRLRDVASAVSAEAPLHARRRHHQTRAGAPAASKKRRNSSGSFRPGDASTPLETSTANGPTISIACATLSALKP